MNMCNCGSKAGKVKYTGVNIQNVNNVIQGGGISPQYIDVSLPVQGKGVKYSGMKTPVEPILDGAVDPQ